MSQTLDEILTALETQGSIFGITGISQHRLTDLFVLYANHNQRVFTVKADGTVDVDPTFTVGQAADEFWKWITTHTNLMQLAVEQAKRDEREAVAKLVEDQGKQWGLLRSVKMTTYSKAAKDLADLIRK